MGLNEKGDVSGVAGGDIDLVGGFAEALGNEFADGGVGAGENEETEVGSVCWESVKEVEEFLGGVTFVNTVDDDTVEC